MLIDVKDQNNPIIEHKSATIPGMVAALESWDRALMTPELEKWLVELPTDSEARFIGTTPILQGIGPHDDACLRLLYNLDSLQKALRATLPLIVSFVKEEKYLRQNNSWRQQVFANMEKVMPDIRRE